MSWYNSISDLTGDIKSGVKDVGHAAGDVLKYAAPAATLIPGVGPGLAALGEAAGQLLAPGGNLGKAAIGGGLTYGTGKLAQSVEGLLGGSGGDSGASAGAATGATGTGPSVGVTGDGVNPAISVPTNYGSIAGASGSIPQSIESFLSGNGGKLLLGGAEAVNQASQQKASTDYAKDALGTATAAYNAKAPLRAQALASLLNPQTPSLAGVNKTMTQGNPWAAQSIPSTLPTSVPLPVPT